MPKYNYRKLLDGTPCRKVHLLYMLSADLEKDILRWAKRRGWIGTDIQLVRKWLHFALYVGVGDEIDSERATDEDEEEERTGVYSYREEPEEGQSDGVL